MAAIGNSSRREFLGALGAGVAARAPSPRLRSRGTGGATLKIVDFHNHFMGPSWTLTNLANVPPAARALGKINAISRVPAR